MPRCENTHCLSAPRLRFSPLLFALTLNKRIPSLTDYAALLQSSETLEVSKSRRQTKKPSAPAWNPRRRRAARETAETFWHNASTVCPGRTIKPSSIIKTIGDLQVRHLLLWVPAEILPSGRFYPLLLPLQRRVRKFRGKRWNAQQERDPPFRASRADRCGPG